MAASPAGLPPEPWSPAGGKAEPQGPGIHIILLWERTLLPGSLFPSLVFPSPSLPLSQFSSTISCWKGVILLIDLRLSLPLKQPDHNKSLRSSLKNSVKRDTKHWLLCALRLRNPEHSKQTWNHGVSALKGLHALWFLKARLPSLPPRHAHGRQKP